MESTGHSSVKGKWVRTLGGCLLISTKVQDYARKTDLSKSHWIPKRKWGGGGGHECERQMKSVDIDYHTGDYCT